MALAFSCFFQLLWVLWEVLDSVRRNGGGEDRKINNQIWLSWRWDAVAMHGREILEVSEHGTEIRRWKRALSFKSVSPRTWGGSAGGDQEYCEAQMLNKNPTICFDFSGKLVRNLIPRVQSSRYYRYCRIHSKLWSRCVQNCWSQHESIVIVVTKEELRKKHVKWWCQFVVSIRVFAVYLSVGGVSLGGARPNQSEY
jgi:hypothetical protein